MPKTHPEYPAEFRAEAVRLAKSGNRSVAGTARELGVNHGTLRKWVRQAAIDAHERSDGLTTEELAELRKLRRENRILKEEKEILIKAAAYFAKETDP
jgi:transposase-like protein